ncbi:MAG: hypothetical protein ACREAE_01885 [Nitrosopumilaceae archaeon]
MRVASYYLLDARDIENWQEFKTKGTVFHAAQEVRDANLYEPVVVKVIKEEVEKLPVEVG